MHLRLILAAALAVGLSSPVLAQTAYTTARPVTPGTNVAAGSGYRAACSAAGFVRLIMTDGTLYDIYASQGTGGEDGIAVVGVATTGTPSPAGTCTVTVLATGARR
jgi:hypothetical protein